MTQKLWISSSAIGDYLSMVTMRHDQHYQGTSRKFVAPKKPRNQRSLETEILSFIAHWVFWSWLQIATDAKNCFKIFSVRTFRAMYCEYFAHNFEVGFICQSRRLTSSLTMITFCNLQEHLLLQDFDESNFNYMKAVLQQNREEHLVKSCLF